MPLHDGRASDGHNVGRYVRNYCCTRPDDGACPNIDAWNDAGPRADKRVGSADHIARQVAARRDVHAILDHVVVVDGCAGVDNGKPANPAAGIDYDARHYHSAFSNVYVRSDDCTWMDRLGEMPPAVEDQQSELPTQPRFADRNEYVIVFKKFGLLEAATATQKRNFADQRSRRPIVQKSRQGSARDLESVGDHAAVAPATKDYDW
jgi:hypothetical protein